VKIAELIEELAAGRVRPVYLLAGSEPLLRDDALAALRTHVLDGGAEDFNLDRLSGPDTTPAVLSDALRTLPVMSARRLVVLRDPDAGRGKALVESLPERIAELLAQDQVVLAIASDKADRRARWVKAVGEPGVRVECEPPRGTREVAAFARAEAERQGLALEAAAAELLAERIGPQLLLLRQEIAKAALLAGDGEPVTRAHVEASTQHVADQPIWDLTDAIGEGKAMGAVLMLDRIQRGGAAPPVVLGSLASHFRKLLRLRSGGSVPGPPFVQQKLSRQARRYTVGRLEACMAAIHETDLALKGAGSLAPELALERLVIALAS